jgi:hypothetical protein
MDNNLIGRYEGNSYIVDVFIVASWFQIYKENVQWLLSDSVSAINEVPDFVPRVCQLIFYFFCIF